MNERKTIHCTLVMEDGRCRYTGGNCTDEKAENCTDYKSDEGLYECPHCNRKGLKLMDYGNDKVWECVRCGAELWYCESVEEMKQRCNEIKNVDKEK